MSRGPVMGMVADVAERLRSVGYRIHVDDREDRNPGFKFNEWELRGVPVRIEIGPKDVEKNSVMLARRDVPGKAGKKSHSSEELLKVFSALLNDIQANMLKQATEFRDANLHETDDYEEFKQIVQDGWVLVWHCGGNVSCV